jgi:hypothetical protein
LARLAARAAKRTSVKKSALLVGNSLKRLR